MKSLAADIILVVHFCFIAFVLGGQGCILLGAWRRWAWVRQRTFRVIHIVAVAIIVVQTWLGMACPLTVWENAFRRAAGEGAYPGTFIGYWVSKLVYYDAPAWVFAVAYMLFGVIVVASWFAVKPVKRK